MFHLVKKRVYGSNDNEIDEIFPSIPSLLTGKVPWFFLCRSVYTMFELRQLEGKGRKLERCIFLCLDNNFGGDSEGRDLKGFSSLILLMDKSLQKWKAPFPSLIDKQGKLSLLLFPSFPFPAFPFSSFPFPPTLLQSVKLPFIV